MRSRDRVNIAWTYSCNSLSRNIKFTQLSPIYTKMHKLLKSMIKSYKRMRVFKVSSDKEAYTLAHIYFFHFFNITLLPNISLKL